MKRVALLVCGLATAAVLVGTAQSGLDPAKLLKPGTDSWPSYNGDYTGRRFSTLTKINDGNVGALSLGWVYRLNPGAGSSNVGSIQRPPPQINGVM
jgi:alcohol dehydrogenase (cytochrome c)